MRRVTITGYGVVCALGQGKELLAKALAEGRSAVAPVTLFDTGVCRCHTAAEVAAGGRDILDRTGQFIELAVTEALADAGLTRGSQRIAVFQGTAHGPFDLWLRGGNACAAQPARLGETTWSSLADLDSVITLTSACVASTWAAGLALNAIRRGEADLALVVGAEGLTDFLFRGFDALRLLTQTRCRPFDMHRDGLVLGEGAAVLVLESEDAARRRGAPIRAELAGFGAAADASHLTAPDISGKGAAAALAHALDDANVAKIDYINLHGTGTTHNDRMELNAFRRVFQNEAATIPVSSTKAMTGHTSGAAGAIEMAICLAALEQELIPPTVGLEEPDPACKGLDLVEGESRHHRCNTVASLNSAFGGNNAALVLRRYQ